MILFKDIDEFRSILVGREKSSGLFMINSILGGLLTMEEDPLVEKIASYVDPEGKFSQKIDINSPLPEKLEDKDYAYIKKCFKRVKNLVSESNSLRSEAPALPNFGENLFGALNSDIVSFVRRAMVPTISRIYLQDVDKIRSVIPSELSKQLEKYSRSISSWYEFTNNDFLGLDTSSVDRFITSYTSLTSVVEKFTKNREEFVYKANQVIVNNKSFSAVDFDYLLMGWWDEISKEFKSDECILEYKKKIASINLRKFDLCLILATYNKRINNESSGLNKLMETNADHLLEYFWSNVEDIKNKLFRENVMSTPTHVINVFWSMFTEKIEEE